VDLDGRNTRSEDEDNDDEDTDEDIVDDGNGGWDRDLVKNLLMVDILVEFDMLVRERDRDRDRMGLCASSTSRLSFMTR
jgi:hypothetical protein